MCVCVRVFGCWCVCVFLCVCFCRLTCDFCHTSLQIHLANEGKLLSSITKVQMARNKETNFWFQNKTIILRFLRRKEKLLLLRLASVIK